jgi:NADH dehydrogenase [ubiquinone] 1 alpha subcomplex assembly factor 5
MSGLSRFTAVLSFKEVLPRIQRGYATSSTTTPFQVFNTDIKRRQRNRSATLDPETSRRTDYLRDEVAMRLIERFMVLVLRTEVDFSSSIVDFVPS